MAAAGILALAGGALFAVSANSPAPARSQPATSEAGFAALRARGRLVVAADPHAPPMISGNPGAYEGFEYALMAVIAETAKVPLELRETAYDDLLDTVAGGQADVAVGQLPPRKASGVEFSKSYLQFGLCLVTRDPAHRRLADLRGRAIGLYDDPGTEQAIRAALGTEWTPKKYGDYGYFQDLQQGRIDGVVYDCPLARYELQKDGLDRDLHVVDPHVATGTWSIAVGTATPGLRDDVDRTLVELGNNGLLQQLASRWLGGVTAESGPTTVTVQVGETVDDVARRAQVSPTDLTRWNKDILGSGAPITYAGMVLRLQ